jgi:hypothetical protein
VTRWALLQGGAVLTVVEAAAQPPAMPYGQWRQADAAVGPGHRWTGAEWQAPVAAVPPAVTMRQARLALLGAGLLDDVEAAIDAIPDATQRAAARITWDHSQEVQRTNGLVVQLATALGLTEAQIDALFVEAATL